MISKEDIQGLAKLARLELSDADLPTLGGDIGHILAFVEVIQKAEGPAITSAPLHRNVMREDGTPHEGNLHCPTHTARQSREKTPSCMHILKCGPRVRAQRRGVLMSVSLREVHRH